jgi:hypothetical protein
MGNVEKDVEELKNSIKNMENFIQTLSAQSKANQNPTKPTVMPPGTSNPSSYTWQLSFNTIYEKHIQLMPSHLMLLPPICPHSVIQGLKSKYQDLIAGISENMGWMNKIDQYFDLYNIKDDIKKFKIIYYWSSQINNVSFNWDT